MKITFSQSAIEDIEAIKVYYHDQGVPQIGTNFVAAIIAQIERLLQQPDIGRVVPELNEKSIRELIHAPFRVVYLRGEDTIQIVRVCGVRGC